MDIVMMLLYEAMIHIGMEILIDRSSVLRNLCRKNTISLQASISKEVRKGVQQAIEQTMQQR
jgi:hypothetical protein